MKAEDFECARCDWKPGADGEPPLDQLAAHRTESGHPTCICCFRSLQSFEELTCDHCIQRARENLSGVVLMWAELPLHFGPRGKRLDAGASGGDLALSGGAALVLAGPGAEGGAARRLTTLEASKPERWWLLGRVGPLTALEYQRAERDRAGREHAIDNKSTDPASVAQWLGSWEADWRSEFDEPDDRRLSLGRALVRAAGYLERRMFQAGHSHLAFDAFTQELHDLHKTLERVTARDLPTEKANADCFDCGGDLVRVVDPATGLSTENVSCRRCHAIYDPQRYALALRAAWESKAEWVSLREAARAARVSVDHVKKWVQRGHVAAACPVEGGVQQVWWPDVLARVSKKEAS